jgi:hypothetical protein
MAQILTAEQLLTDIQAWIESAKDSQVERLTELATDPDMTREQKSAKMLEIASEKYTVEAIINQLKPVVSFEGNTYELPRRVPTAKSTGTTGTKTLLPEGTRLQYKYGESVSAIYHIQNGELVDPDGVKAVANTISTQVIAESKGMSVDEYKAWYEKENGRKFTGVAGLSDEKHWLRLPPEA